MFESFYQLREQPFGINPDPRFLYLSRTHREAFSSLLYRIQTNSGFLAMVAPPGMGKTTLLFHLLHLLQPAAKTAFIFQTQCTSHELLRHMLLEFECDASITDTVRMSQELKSLLLTEANAGRRCVLVIDEAQNLQPEVLETIRLLSNFETPRRKLLNIILSGQGELGEMLTRPGLHQLRQRLSCMVYIQRFTPEETALYIAHRLEVAGYSGKVSELFSIQALTRVAQLSEGVPRVINNICFNALSLGFALDSKKIDTAIVEEVADDLGLSTKALFAETGSAQIRAFPTGGLSHDFVAGQREEDSGLLSAVSEACAQHESETAQPLEAAAEVNEIEFHEQTSHDSAYEAEASVSQATFSSGSSAAISELTDDPRDVPAEHSTGQVPTAPKPPASHVAQRDSTRPFLVRALMCLLILCIAPIIDAPAHRSVSAQNVTDSANGPSTRRTPPLLASKSPTGQPRRLSRSTSVQKLHEGNAHTEWPLKARRESGMTVDLALASFAPEPLLAPEPLYSMPLPTRNSSSNPKPAVRADSIRKLSAGKRNIRPLYLPPKPIWQPAPSYPNVKRAGYESGDVQLVLSVSDAGDVQGIGVLNGSDAFVAAAKRTVASWKYSPALSNGVPVSSQVYVTVQFRRH